MDETENMLTKQGKRFDTMKVLIVDGDEITASYSARAFGRLGMSYEVAQSPETAIQMMQKAVIKGKSYDICLLNCDTGQTDIYDTVFRIRKCNPSDNMVVACSFRRGSHCKGRMENAGGNYYIERPLLQSNLYQMMTEVRKDGFLMS